jgi:hypothetical protein
VVLQELQQRPPVKSRLEVEILILRVDPEVVVVRPMARRRRRTSIAGLPGRVDSGDRVAPALGQTRGNSGDAVRDPVREAVQERRIGIVHDDRERLRAVRDTRPLQRRGDVLAIGGVAPWDRLVVEERRAAKRQVRHVERLGHDPGGTHIGGAWHTRAGDRFSWPCERVVRQAMSAQETVVVLPREP